MKTKEEYLSGIEEIAPTITQKQAVAIYNLFNYNQGVQVSPPNVTQEGGVTIAPKPQQGTIDITESNIFR